MENTLLQRLDKYPFTAIIFSISELKMPKVEVMGFVSQIVPYENLGNVMVTRQVDWDCAQGKDMVQVCFVKEIFPKMRKKRLFMRLRLLSSDCKLAFHRFSPEGSLPIWFDKGHGLEEGDKVKLTVNLELY
jgi:hypothetical protein